MKQKLMDALCAKMEQEQNTFVTALEASTPKNVLDHAYRKVMQDDILMCMESIELSIPQIKALLALEKPLASLYDDWLDNDCSHMEMLRDTIEDSANKYIKDMVSQKNFVKER